MEKAPGEQQGKRRSKIGCSSTAATNLAAISYGSATGQPRNTTQPNAQQLVTQRVSTNSERKRAKESRREKEREREEAPNLAATRAWAPGGGTARGG